MILYSEDKKVKTIDYLDKLYPQNSDGAYVIEVQLEYFIDAFNKWDYAYMEARELNPGLIFFVERCSDDIPIKKAIELKFIVAEKNEEHEIMLRKALELNFKYQIFLENQNIRSIYRKTVKYFITAVFLLVVTFLLKPVSSLPLLYDIVTEGVMIGGWVFLWQSISLLSFDVLEYIKKKKSFERLADSKVTIKYSPKKFDLIS